MPRPSCPNEACIQSIGSPAKVVCHGFSAFAAVDADGSDVAAADVRSQRVRTRPTSVWAARGLPSNGLPI